MMDYISPRYRLVFIIISAGIIHAALFLFDFNNPEAFLAGDRSVHRIGIIKYLQKISSDTSITEIMVGTGSPGDYIFHSVVYAWQGMLGVIFIQILFQLVSIIYVYRIVNLVFNTSFLSLLAASIYAILPSGLYNPHVLVSETFFNPLVVVSFFYCLSYLSNDSPKIRHLLIAAILGSCASFIRLIYVLYPLFFAGIILLKKSRHLYRISHIVAYITVSFSIPLLWASYMFIQTANFTMGNSVHDFKYNLYGRVVRMEGLNTNIKTTSEQQERSRLQLSEYLNYIFEYPTIYLKTLGSDITNISLNSGINSFLGRYLGLYKMPDTNREYWHEFLDKEGVLELAKAMYKNSPLMLLVNLLITPIWIFFLGFVWIGIYAVVTNNRLEFSVKAALFSLPAYLLLASQSAISVRWGFRTPFEFILVLFFVAAVSWFQERREKTL